MENNIYEYFERAGWSLNVETVWEQHVATISRGDDSKTFTSYRLGLAVARAVCYVASYDVLESLNLLGWFE